MMTVLKICIGFLLSGFLATNAWADLPQAQVSWFLGQESDLAGYRIYQTTQSGVYQTATVIDAHLSTSVTIYLPSTRCNVTYYWVVTAYDTGGHESPPSHEVSKTIPGTQNWIGACKK